MEASRHWLLRVVLSIFVVSTVFAQSIETIPSPTSSLATCSSCLLEALNPATLTYPTESAQANTTILVAIVSATPYTDSQGRTVSIEFHTEYIPKVETPVANNATALFSATWTTLGTTLTWPTTYVAYSNFGYAPKCTGSTSSLSLPQATDPARLIFPLGEPLDIVSNSVADYLDDLHIVGNGTDLNACSWVVNSDSGPQQVVRRFGNLPVPFGRRNYGIVKRITNSTAPGLVAPIQNSTLPNNGTLPPPVSPVVSIATSLLGLETEAPVPKVTAALLTDTRFGQARPISVATALPSNPDSANGGTPPDSTNPDTTVRTDGNPDDGKSGNTVTQGSDPGRAIFDTLTGQDSSQGQSSGAQEQSSSSQGQGSGSQGQGSDSSSNISPQVVDIGGGQVTVSPAATGQGGSPGEVVVGAQTLQTGQVGTVNGVAVSIATDGNIVIDGSRTVAVNNNPAITPPTLTVGGSTITANPSGIFSVAPGVALTPGRPAVTISGTTLSIASGGSIAVVNGATQTLAGNEATQPILTLGGQTVTGNIVGSSTAFVFSPSQTLTAGGVIVVSGTSFSLPASGSAVVINGQTSVFGSSSAFTAAPPILTVDGKGITAGVSGSITSFVIAPGTTLTQGGSVIVSGTTYSLPQSGSVVLINGKESTLARGDPSITSSPALTINGHTYSAITSNGKTYYDLGSGTTLTPGGVITSDGTRISLASDGSSLIIGSSTSKISTSPKSTSVTTTRSTTPSTTRTGDTIASGLGTTKKAAGTRVMESPMMALHVVLATTWALWHSSYF